MDPTFWNERFGQSEYIYGREPNDFLRAEAHRIPKGRVLCLSEGEGRNAVFLAGLGHDVTALDYSVEGLKKAEKLAAERGVRITTLQADLASYDLEVDAYTGIVSIFGHLPSEIRRRVFGQIPRALRAGGVFLLEHYTPAQIALGTGGPKSEDLLPTLALLKEEVAGDGTGPAMTYEIGVELEREIQEGSFHAGKSATVQVVARRA